MTFTRHIQDILKSVHQDLCICHFQELCLLPTDQSFPKEQFDLLLITLVSASKAHFGPSVKTVLATLFEGLEIKFIQFCRVCDQLLLQILLTSQ
jgi:hypothetical protein